jgi:hypothetical protein
MQHAYSLRSFFCYLTILAAAAASIRFISTQKKTRPRNGEQQMKKKKAKVKIEGKDICERRRRKETKKYWAVSCSS